ncbi:carbohydrate kinase [Falsiroseomonas bella]|uniref:Carbohydrate kinase n=1 Tax=Falsiroseomonas bella TaxID=2184016 RepID=A0A317FCI5_9PROT|nr:FGGY-family carbohydrate kinase [Falsiroseomonas bella]PWS36555.1 carbohydrate kinase [Falsiroseomonas bella]
MRGTVLAVDLGGSSLRVALVGGEGGIRALHALPQRSGAEAEPEDWWRAVQAGAEALLAADPAGFATLRAVAVSAFTRSLVLVDRAGAVLRPAILWGDTRAEARLPALHARLPDGHAETAQISAFHPLARLFWLAGEEPGVLSRAAAAIEPKDYLNACLTGAVASDVISSARLAASATLFASAGLPALLPPLNRPGEVMGHVRAGLPGALARLAGLPVMAMAHDSWAAVLGLGAMRAGCAYCISGTTEVLGLLHDAPAVAPGLLTVDWGGLWQLGGPSQHGADLLAWLAAMGVAAEEAPPGDPLPLLFLPTLAGERVPHWDPALRGAFLGLAREHGAAEMRRAVMQGVALNNRTVLERAEAATGRAAEELRLGGGGAMPGWAQLRADVLGRPVVLTEGREPGLLGCAVAAFAALEDVPLEVMQARLVRTAAQFAPDPRRHAMATRLHALFRQAEEAVAPVSRALAGFS